MRKTLLSLLLPSLIVPAEIAAQNAGAPMAALEVFLDCNARSCQSDHIRNEIAYVNWVRDRTVADVHLLITSQGTGSGGERYALAFVGLGAFGGDSTTIALSTEQTATDSERRDRLTARIAQGLMRYLVHTSAADAVQIGLVQSGRAGASDESAAAATTPASDPWNAWVFSLGFDGSMEGEARETEHELTVELRASRVTRDWKLDLEVEGDYSRNRFELSDGTFVSVTEDWGVDAFLARSVARLWSAGLEMRAGSSTFDNQDLRVRIAPVLEYSVFPYEDFTRRQITLRYSVGANQWNYIEETLYGYMDERRWDHELELDLEFRQLWGSARANMSGSHFLHDANKYRASIGGGLDIRLIRGLSLDVSGSYSRVHDQLYVEGEEGLTDQEILLRLRSLQTNYEFDTRVGLRYTFGSVYNNIVNPRLNRDRF